MNESISIGGTITFAIAILGAVLGIINTWRNINKDRVKLKVTPKYVFFNDGRDNQLSIEIINFSAFSLTITEVGVYYHGSTERAAVIEPHIYDGGSFPRKLEQRNSFSVYLPIGILKAKNNHKVKCVYVTTACGESVRGTSPALKDMIKKMEQN